MSNTIGDKTIAATTTTSESPFKMSIEEESCLKSALAFVVIRQRLIKSSNNIVSNKREKQKLLVENDTTNKQPKRIHILENILTPNIPPTDHLILPSKEDHILSMLQVCLGTIHSLFHQYKKCKFQNADNNISPPPLYSYYSTTVQNNTFLDGVLSHLSIQLYQYQPKLETTMGPSSQKTNNILNQLLRKILKKNNTNVEDVICICIFLHQLVLHDEERNREYNNDYCCGLGLSMSIIETVSSEIFGLYNDDDTTQFEVEEGTETSSQKRVTIPLSPKSNIQKSSFDISTWTVNLVHLLDSIISTIFTKTSSSQNNQRVKHKIIQILQQNLSELLLMIQYKDMMNFYYNESMLQNKKKKQKFLFNKQQRCQLYYSHKNGSDKNMLDAGEKMLLRIFLMNIFQKLCSY